MPLASRFGSAAARLTSLACSCTALVLTVIGLFEWDVPLTRFIRSLNDYHIEHLANPWLAQLSDVGDRLGRGESLVVISLILLAVGYGLTHPTWKDAGWQSLIAHGIAAALSNLLKHLVGRPRPKFMHAGTTELAPVGGGGWDSFPSGHAAASFAVAMVLATRFPRARWGIVLVAMAIATSRILRGSHFLTDVVGGAVLGCLVGSLAAHPWREWRSSLEQAIHRLVPVLVAIFVFLWTVLHLPSTTWAFQSLMVGGIVLTFAGLLGHLAEAMEWSWRPALMTRPLAQETIGLGLGMTTGSLWVTVVVLLACAGDWLRRGCDQKKGTAERIATDVWESAIEGLFVAAVLVALVASVELKGLIPMQ